MFKRGLPPKSPWRSLQQREWLVFLLWLGYIPGVLILGYPLSRVFDSETPFIIVGLTWMGAFAIAGIALSSFRCPRCGKPYFRKWWFNNPLARKCVHCAFPLWSEVEHRQQALQTRNTP